jgi:hypothetical protein
MSNRATYLARLLVSRLRQLEVVLSDDGAPDEQTLTGRRQDVVAKILAVEEGIVDGRTVQLVTSALPHIDVTSPTPDRDVTDLASFLATQLGIK